MQLQTLIFLSLFLLTNFIHRQASAHPNGAAYYKRKLECKKTQGMHVKSTYLDCEDFHSTYRFSFGGYQTEVLWPENESIWVECRMVYREGDYAFDEMITGMDQAVRKRKFAIQKWRSQTDKALSFTAQHPDNHQISYLCDVKADSGTVTSNTLKALNFSQSILEAKTKIWENYPVAEGEKLTLIPTLQEENFNGKVFFQLPILGAREFVRVYTTRGGEKLVIKHRFDDFEVNYAIAAYLFSKNEHIANVPKTEGFRVDGKNYVVMPMIEGEIKTQQPPSFDTSVEDLFDHYLDAEVFVFDAIVAHGDIDFENNLLTDPNGAYWFIDNQYAFSSRTDGDRSTQENHFHINFSPALVKALVPIEENISDSAYRDMKTPKKLYQILDEALKRQKDKVEKIVSKDQRYYQEKYGTFLEESAIKNLMIRLQFLKNRLEQLD
ncbi:MAG: hypothetical protein KDK51_01815 [Deltaproteobacteria bacterium]|nr:hypothetical protein [Deltaproteobacteria bacterium]